MTASAQLPGAYPSFVRHHTNGVSPSPRHQKSYLPMAYGGMWGVLTQMGLYAAMAGCLFNLGHVTSTRGDAIAVTSHHIRCLCDPIAGGDRRNTHDFGGRSRDERDF